MKKTLYHGTTFEGYEGIKLNGFKNVERVWNVSDYNSIYFYCPEECEEGCNTEENVNICIDRAFEAAQMAAAINGSKSKSIYVLEIEIDDEEIELNSDNDCPGSEYFAKTLDIRDIKNLKANVYKCDSYFEDLRLFYLMGVWDSRYLNMETKLGKFKFEILEEFSKKAPYISELWNFDWEKTKEVIILK